MRRLLLFFLPVLLVLLSAPAYASPLVLNETADDALDASLTNSAKDVRLTNERNFNYQNTNNTALWNQIATKWESGRAYTADNNMLAHDGHIFLCTVSHTASAGTEPGTGASWQTVWKYSGEDLSGADIKTAYESQADTNAFTDAEKAKLLGIEEGATAGGGIPEAPDDGTTYGRNSENWVAMAGGGDMVAANNLSEVTPAAARTNLQVYSMTDADERYSLSAHTHSEYADAIHQHAIANITDLDNQLSAKAGISDVLSKVNTVAYTPTLPYHPATVQYVDDNVFDGAYSSLSGTPTLGTAAATDATAYATAAQGATADTAVQPGDVQTITPVAPIVYDSGNLSLADTAVIPGSYTNVNVTVDQKGRITTIANGTGGSSTAAETTVTDTGGNFTGTDVEEVLAEIAGDMDSISVGSPVTTAPTYRDDTCTKGQYAFSVDGLTKYECSKTDFWVTQTLSNTLSDAPSTYTFTWDIVDGNGTDYITYDSSNYTIDGSDSGLTADASFTVTADTGREGVVTGSCVSGTGPYSANTDTEDCTATITFSDAGGGDPVLVSADSVLYTSGGANRVSLYMESYTPIYLTAYTPSESIDLAQLDFYAYKVGSPPGTVSAVIFNDNGSDLPAVEAPICISTNSITATDLGIVESDLVEWNFDSTCNLTSGTQYWRGLMATTQGDSSNRVVMQMLVPDSGGMVHNKTSASTYVNGILVNDKTIGGQIWKK